MKTQILIDSLRNCNHKCSKDCAFYEYGSCKTALLMLAAEKIKENNAKNSAVARQVAYLCLTSESHQSNRLCSELTLLAAEVLAEQQKMKGEIV